MNTVSLLHKYIKHIFPVVDKELKGWNDMACSSNSLLAEQAQSSIKSKGFHAKGGCAFALYPGCEYTSMVKLIVAYQTISDYLDNLCDRMGVEDDEAFKCLHLSMFDALDPEIPIHEYYKLYPLKDDGGYLAHLVDTCRSEISRLPSYHLAKKTAFEYAKTYSDMQSFKHTPPDIREKRLFGWADMTNKQYPEMESWEFCAASGSTLGIFMLLAVSSNPQTDEHTINELGEIYFPWICCLHILLDYFIDYNEDMENHELNFIQYYKNSDEILERFIYYIDISMKKADSSDYPIFHRTIISGLLSLYLSDRKAYEYNLKNTTHCIVSSYGIKLKLMHSLCIKLRKKLLI